MKLETLSEQRERELREAKEQGRQMPGRTLPRGRQWNGLDQPGCGAARRRLRQAAKALEAEFRKAMQTKDLRDIS